MEACYEYLGCTKSACCRHGNKDGVNCWDVDETLCNHPGMELIEEAHKDKCHFCIYYKSQQD